LKIEKLFWAIVEIWWSFDGIFLKSTLSRKRDSSWPRDSRSCFS